MWGLVREHAEGGAGVHDAVVFSVCKVGLLRATGWGRADGHSMCDIGGSVWYMRDGLMCAARAGCAVVYSMLGWAFVKSR